MCSWPGSETSCRVRLRKIPASQTITEPEPYSPPGTNADMEAAVPAMAVRLWRMGVNVRWPGTPGNERSVALASVRVAIKEPNP